MKRTSFLILISVISVFANKTYSQTNPEVQGSDLTVLQQNSISGTVTNEAGEPLPGVTVVIKGTSNGTVTNMDGKYSISNIPDGATLAFTFVGMLSQEIVVGNQTSVNVTLAADAIGLEEVVVTALGINSKKKSLGYSVDKVDGNEISNTRETNLVNSLSGKVAGVHITPSSTGMGGSSRVILRGNSSLSGNNQPLYVVDGVPISNVGFGSANSGGTGISSGRDDFGSGISDVNPNDIASVSVLKGANAAALYGNRAANGAIIITTKKGKARRGIGVDYSGSVMVSSLNESTLPQYQNEYGQGDAGVFANDSENSWGAKFDGSNFTYPSGLEGVYSAQPNNVKDAFKNGLELANMIALEGGSEKAAFRFSYTNFTGKGILKPSDLSKNTFNIRVNGKLTDKLSFESKVTYFTLKSDSRQRQGWAAENTRGIYPIARNTRIDDLRDNYMDEYGVIYNPLTGQTGVKNPFYNIYEEKNSIAKDRVIGHIKLDYVFNKNLRVFARLGTDANSFRREYILPQGGDLRNDGSRSNNTSRYTETNADFLLMFNKQLNDNFNLSLNGGGNYRYNLTEVSGKSGLNFKLPSSVLYNNLTTISGTESSLRSSIYSLYFSGTLDFKEMIYLNFSGRNDWDSQMWTASGESSDWSFFYPSVSISLLGNDLLNIDQGILSFSKLRLAWSEVGSGGIKNDDIYYFLGNTAGYNDLITLTQSSIFDDPTLKPETTKAIEVGLELRFFKDRLYTDFTYYNRTTYDQIINAPVDASTGFSYKRTNVGEISNNGFELMVGATLVKSENFTWEASANMSKNSSVLESYIEGSDAYVFTTADEFSVKTIVGGNYGDIWGTNFTYNDQGKMVVDESGLPVVSDEEFLGNYLPDMQYGVTNTFKYKDLSFSFLIDGQVGGSAYSWTQKNLSSFGVLDITLEGRDGMVLDAVDESGAANTKEITSQQYWNKTQGIAGAHMQDLSHLRLRQLSLSYDLPVRILRETFIERASVSLIGRNLFFIYKKASGVDPESSLSMTNNGQGYFMMNLPSTRKIGLSLNLSF